jgi:hypothetical protein
MPAYTKDDIADISEDAANKALAKFMLALGYNVEEPSDILRLQAQFRHLSNQYEACKVVTNIGIKTAVTTVLTALGAYLVMWFGWPKLPGH